MSCRSDSIVITLLISTLLIGTPLAHTGATGVVKKRMDAMSDMGDKSKLIAAMLKGESDYDAKTVSEVADAYIKHGADIPGLFPDDEMSRTSSETEALPAIWDEWQDFVELSAKLTNDSKALKKLADSGITMGTLKKAFVKATKNCSTCHKRFREPKD
ncbi:MAG: cytochrome c [Granulosicoccus sp.]